MLTLTFPHDRLDEVRPGDRLVAIDDVALGYERIFTDGPQRLWPNGPIGIPYEYGGAAPAYLYPDSMIRESITVERVEQESEQPAPAPAPAKERGVPIAAALSPGTYIPEEEIRPADEHGNRIVPAPPTVFLHERERKALMRNRHYEETLRLLDDGKGGAVDLRSRVPLGGGNGLHPASHYSHQAGMLATWYGWTERVADYTWRLTAKGRRVLAALDQGMGGPRR